MNKSNTSLIKHNPNGLYIHYTILGWDIKKGDMMNNLMQVDNKKLEIREYKGQRVVTVDDIDRVHNRSKVQQVEILGITKSTL